MKPFVIPGLTQSTNIHIRGGSWKVAAAQHKTQKCKAMTLCPRWTEGPLLVVLLTRFSAGELDDDNLRGSLKGYRDGIAARLKLDDGSPLVRWEYAQQRCDKGKGHVEVRIERVTPLPDAT